MEERKTNIFLSSATGETIINELPDERCLSCISSTLRLQHSSLNCPLEKGKKRVAIKSSSLCNLYVCDDKEKSATNFNSMVELLYHSSKTVFDKHSLAKKQAIETVRNEIDSFKHNIEHINSDAINEFYSYIPQDTFVKNFRRLQESVDEALKKDKKGGVDLITRLARYNLNIKTELSIITKLSSEGGKPNFSRANPRDAIMTNVYMLYPDFRAKEVYVDVGEYRERFDIDFEAIQVATYYIIENAAKYTSDKSQFNINFVKRKDSLRIEFNMYSLYIEPADVPLIFDEGFKSEAAKETGLTGKGIGLYRAKRLVSFCKGQLSLEAGTIFDLERDGFNYANNSFVIELPLCPTEGTK